MITLENLAASFGQNVHIIQRQTDGLSHADSLLQLPFRGNCLNWVVGHILNSRIGFMEDLLGIVPLVPRVELARYVRGSAPITHDEADILPLERLLALIQATQEPLANRILALTPDELDAIHSHDSTLGKWLFFQYFHETYHVGQTEILRQLAGTDDQII